MALSFVSFGRLDGEKKAKKKEEKRPASFDGETVFVFSTDCGGSTKIRPENKTKQKKNEKKKLGNQRNISRRPDCDESSTKTRRKSAENPVRFCLSNMPLGKNPINPKTRRKIHSNPIRRLKYAGKPSKLDQSQG